LLPAAVRLSIVERVPRELTAAAVLGGTPSTAHTEALLRAIEFKGAAIDEPLDAIVIGIPPTTPFLPRAMPNPVTAAYLGLGLALRLWRNTFPVKPGGTAILVHDFARRFPAPTQLPYRALFADQRTARDSDALREAERTALADARAIGEYRAGRAVHPLEPFLAWSACDASISRLGPVLVAGCRDASAARQLGFVPVHNVGAALAMARGRGAERIGFLLSPPYYPLVVGRAVGEDVDGLDRDEPLGDHLVEHGDDRVDALRSVDHLDHHREVLREAEDARGVQMRVCAEPLDPAHHGRAREPELPDTLDDGLVERPAVPGVGLPDEDPEQLPFALEPRHSALASTVPA
jgi:hypothetical protein